MKRRAAYWWIDRWRKSTAYTDMTAEQQGVYRNLLDELWLREGLLPTDDRTLTKISGDPEAWPRVREVVLLRFVLTPQGYRNLTHDEVAAYPNSQAQKGRKRAEEGKRSEGRFTTTSPAEPPADVPADSPAGNQPEAPAQHQPPYPLPYPYPLPLSVSVSGRTNGPCGHPLVLGRIRPGKTIVCPDCGEEFTGPTSDHNGPKINPFVAGKRVEYEREALRLTGEIAAITGEDGAEIFAQAAHYDGALRQKCNPANLSDDRLLNTVLDLRASLKAEQAKAPKVGA